MAYGSIKNRFTAKRMALLAILTAMSLITFMIESLFPPLFLPGAKMGLSNIFSLLTLIVLGPVEAIVVVLIRTTLGSVFTGNMSTLLYSMSAGLVSILVASLLMALFYPRITVVAVSLVSAVLHNLTQNIVFCLVSATPQMYVYMPWLALLGIVAGVIVGFAVYFIVKYVPLKVFLGVADSLSDTNDVEEDLADATIQSDEQSSEVADDNTHCSDYTDSNVAVEGNAQSDEQNDKDGQKQ